MGEVEIEKLDGFGDFYIWKAKNEENFGSTKDSASLKN